MAKDADMREFRRRLEKTADGQRYLYAWQNMLSIVNMIRLAANQRQVQHYRQEYIKASEEAGRLLELLERRHDWPTPTQG